MASVPNSLPQSAGRPGVVSPLQTAAGVFGASAIAVFAIFLALAEWAATSTSWVFFFLAGKPLIDLTWRWSFFRFSEQSVNPQAIAGVAVLLLNGLALLKGAAWRYLPRRVLVMAAFACLSVLFSPSSWALNELLRLLAGVAFFYSAGPLLADPRQFDRFSKVFLLAMTVPVVLSYFQWAGILPYEYWDWLNNQAVGRASGTYPTPLSMSFFLYYAFPIAMSIATGKLQSGWARYGALGFLLLASGALAVGNHRTAYVVVALQVFLWLVMTRGRRAVLGFVATLVVIVALSAAWLQTLYAPVAGAISGDANFENGELFRGRGFQWLLFLNSYASSSPLHWVFGNGASVIAGYDPEATDVDSVEPHNDYIRILHAYGAVGLLLYLSALALFFRKALQLLKSSAEFPRVLARLMLLVLVAIIIQSMMMEPMRYPTGVWYFFAIASALFCVKTPPARAEGLPA
jgi:O-antigen ligase